MKNLVVAEFKDGILIPVESLDIHDKRLVDDAIDCYIRKLGKRLSKTNVEIQRTIYGIANDVKKEL